MNNCLGDEFLSSSFWRFPKTPAPAGSVGRRNARTIHLGIHGCSQPISQPPDWDRWIPSMGWMTALSVSLSKTVAVRSLNSHKCQRHWSRWFEKDLTSLTRWSPGRDFSVTTAVSGIQKDKRSSILQRKTVPNMKQENLWGIHRKNLFGNGRTWQFKFLAQVWGEFPVLQKCPKEDTTMGGEPKSLSW